jgi:hypothetical protein
MDDGSLKIETKLALVVKVKLFILSFTTKSN